MLVFDTSVLCVWLRVPGKDTCGSGENRLTYEIVNSKIEEEKKAGTTFVLPIASIIETGNHIAHSAGDRSGLGDSFADVIKATADKVNPWAAFTEQSELWKKENLIILAERWKKSVVSGQALGDASIVDVVQYYAKAGFEVEIFTDDAGLKAYQPTNRVLVPRRRKQ